MFYQQKDIGFYVKLDNGWIKASKVVGFYKEQQIDQTFVVKVLDITGALWFYGRNVSEEDADRSLQDLLNLLTRRDENG